MYIGTIQNGVTGVITGATNPMPFAAGQTLTVTTAGDFIVNLFAGVAQAVSGSAVVGIGSAKSGTTGVVTGSPVEFGSGLTNGLIPVGTIGDISITNTSGYPISVASNGTCHCTTTIIAPGATVSVTVTNAAGNLTVTQTQNGADLLNAGSNVVNVIGTGTIFIAPGVAGLQSAFAHDGKNNNISSLTGDDAMVLALSEFNWAGVTSYVNGGYSLGVPKQEVRGAVTTNGTAVTAITGTVFNVLWAAGTVVMIAGVAYMIASVTSTSALVLQGIGAGVQTAVAFVCDPLPTGIFAGFKEILGVFINSLNGYTFQFNAVTNSIQAYATDGTEASTADLHLMTTPMLIIGI